MNSVGVNGVLGGNNKLSLQYGTLLAGIYNVNSNGSNVPGYGSWDASSLPLTELRSPFGSNENLALAKHFYAGERVSMELRMEFFDVLNRMQVCTPDTTVSDGANNFGYVEPNGSGGSSPCQGNTPRQGQACFKVSF